jgi:peptide deformylase
MDIRIYPDPALRVTARTVENIGSQEKHIFEEMSRAMYAAEGVGLAATQVGVDKRLIVIDVGSGLLKLANPKIIKAWCKGLGEERCLSFPGIRVKIKRPQKVALEAINQDNQKVNITAEGLLARVIQHEMDHLKGIVIIDKIGLMQRLMLARKLWQLKRNKI